MRTYEGMFLFDPTAATDWSNVEAEMARLMDRASAELLVCKKWEERRLAYEIKGRSRGCYVLTYFKAPPDSLANIERDVHLSDQVLRCLLLRADHVSDEKMNEPTPAESVTRPTEDDRHASGDGDSEDSSTGDADKKPSAETSAREEADSPATEEKAEAAESN